MPAKPPAFVHVDMDALWAVRQCYGDAAARPSDDDPVYAEGAPALAKLFEELGVRASIFAVGEDAALPRPAAALRDLAKAGHEIENHSWSHGLGLTDLSDADLAAEIDRAADAIAAATGERPLGFRAPGYDASPRLLRFLAERGYAYDGSVLPTWAGPALRLADAALRRGWPKRRQYGPLRAAFAPQVPYAPDPANPWRAACASATTRESASEPPLPLELPAFVSPASRLPIHAGFAMLRGQAALDRALDDADRRLPSDAPILFLIHGVDATDASGARHPVPGGRGRRFFAAPASEKLAALRRMLEALLARRDIVSTRAWVRARAGG